MTQFFTGGCLCGAVRYSASAEPMFSGHCHCEDCRRSSGTSHSTHVVMPEAAVTLTGALSSYDRPANSGNVVTRFFCPTCGAPVMSKNAAMPGMVFLRASSMDDMDLIDPGMTVYAARAALGASAQGPAVLRSGLPRARHRRDALLTAQSAMSSRWISTARPG